MKESLQNLQVSCKLSQRTVKINLQSVNCVNYLTCVIASCGLASGTKPKSVK